MFMTGARVNFRTLRIDHSVGAGFISQKTSTGQTYDVLLRPGVLPDAQATLGDRIPSLRAAGQPVAAPDIDELERLADALSRRVLNSPPADSVDVKQIENYTFVPIDLFGDRGDVTNKKMPQ